MNRIAQQKEEQHNPSVDAADDELWILNKL